MDKPYWLRWLRWHLIQKRNAPAKKQAEWAFISSARRLVPGDVAIDCGANVGVYTALLAKSGATVYAFEPDPVAFGVLKQKFDRRRNVVLFNQAVGAARGTVRLYRHAEFDRNPVALTTGSSLIPSKVNVDLKRSIEVEQVDFVSFVQSLGRPVRLLKIDIEGAEVELLNALLDADCLASTGSVFVEMHDHKIPNLADGSNELRARIAREGRDNINLDWR